MQLDSTRLVSACAITLLGTCLPHTSRAVDRIDRPDMKDELFADRIYAHEPVYVVVGGRPETDAKFQVSLKLGITDHVFFGYTQLNHWDITKSSAPFRDTTHRPSLFWYGQNPAAPGPGDSGMKTLAFHFSGGWEHNSNGRDTTGSRSIDLLFWRGTGYYWHGDDTYSRLSPRVFAYVHKGSQNRDIANYRRLFDFNYSYFHRNSAGGTYTYAHGRSGRGSHQIDLTYSLRALGLRMWPGFLHMQVFRGYGETLQDYNFKGPTQYRVGYMLERATGRVDRHNPER